MPVSLDTFKTAVNNASDSQRIKLDPNDNTNVKVSPNPVRGKIVRQIKQIAARFGSDNKLQKSQSNDTKVRQAFLDAIKTDPKYSDIPSRINLPVSLDLKPLTKKEVQTVLARLDIFSQVNKTVKDLDRNDKQGLPASTIEKAISDLCDEGRETNPSAANVKLNSIVSENRVSAVAQRQGQGISDKAAERIGVVRATGEVKALGKGAINTVYKGDFGSIKGGVFKATLATDADADPVRDLELPNGKQNLVGRAVAAWVVNDILKASFIGTTKFAEHDGQHGFVTEFANGKSPKTAETELEQANNQNRINGYQACIENGIPLPDGVEIRDGVFFEVVFSYLQFDFTEPELAAKLTELHLFDELTGQCDRHISNVMIDVDSANGKFKSVTAIDNDFSFGPTPDGHHSSQSKLPASLPAIVPKSVADKFLNLTDENLRDKLNGLLQPVEIDNVVDRSHAIKKHLGNLELDSKIIPDSQWNRTLVKDNCNDDNSYVGRYDSDIKHHIEGGRVFDINGQRIDS